MGQFLPKTPFKPDHAEAGAEIFLRGGRGAAALLEWHTCRRHCSPVAECAGVRTEVPRPLFGPFPKPHTRR